ncbi:uncharacterized protein LOC103573655 [Microplitis demolitor]|uniref:uncharacterized protein LOC103573655 n=1 Tax=Microplitis demolitor TaxID=69319 RepID=UPI0004CD3E35|nr:uncharacterized protein LOC103573655 [Microplitis demolitor]
MESLKNVLNDISIYKNNFNLKISYKKKIKATEVDIDLKNIGDLIDESNKDSEQINLSSNSITSYKHVIQKLSESSNEISLPISNVEHNAIISYISDAMLFLTSLEINTNIDPGEKLKLSRTYTLVQTPNENLINEIRNYKITTDKVEVMITNLHILQNSSDLTDTSIDGNNISLDPTLEL